MEPEENGNIEAIEDKDLMDLRNYEEGEEQ